MIALQEQLRDVRARRHYLEDGRRYAHGDVYVHQEVHVLWGIEQRLEKQLQALAKGSQ